MSLLFFVISILVIIFLGLFIHNLNKNNAYLDKENAILKIEKENLSKEINAKDDIINAIKNELNEIKKHNSSNETNNIINAINTKFTETLQNINKEKEEALNSVLNKSNSLKEDLLKQSATKFDEIIKNVTNELANSQKTIQENSIKQDQFIHKLLQDTEKIRNAFTSSNSIGSFHEQQLIVLLENMKFRHNETFYTQFASLDTDNEKKLRPDVVIKLPNNDFMVIDCKSSAAFMPSQNQEAIDDEKLAISMKNHINTLGKKDYFESVLNELKKRNSSISKENAKCSITLMYLPSDTSLERAQNAYDKKYQAGSWFADCKKNNVLPCGPTSLNAIIYMASHSISIEDANKNYAINQEKIKNLLKEINNIIGYVTQVGNYLAKTSETYSKLYKTWNGKFFKQATNFTSNDYKLDIKKMPEYHFAKGEEIEEDEQQAIES